MDKDTARAIVSWIANTTIDIEKIIIHFGINSQNKEKVRQVAKSIRQKKYGDL